MSETLLIAKTDTVSATEELRKRTKRHILTCTNLYRLAVDLCTWHRDAIASHSSDKK